MNPSKKNKLTKEQLLEKYISGDISRDEMHTLNQYAIDDDFLFEALEGLSGFETRNNDSIRELNDRLKEKRKRKRPAYLYWMGAAASIAIIIFSVTILNQSASEVLNEPLVMDQAAMEKDMLEEELAISKAEELELVAVVEPELEKIQVARSQTEEIAVSDFQVKEREAIEFQRQESDETLARLENKVEPISEAPRKTVPPPSVAAAPKPSAAGAVHTRSKSKKESTPQIADRSDSYADDNLIEFDAESKSNSNKSGVNLSGKVVTKAGEPVFGSAIIAMQNKTIATSDQEGRFEMSLPNRDEELVVRTLGFQEQIIKLGFNSQLEIVLEEAEPNSIQVVYFDKQELISQDTAELAEFESYANFNLKLSDEILENIASEYMILEFDVDQRGGAGNFTIIDSLGYGIDEEAIRLIQSFGKWNSGGKIKDMKKKLRLFFKGKK